MKKFVIITFIITMSLLIFCLPATAGLISNLSANINEMNNMVTVSEKNDPGQGISSLTASIDHLSRVITISGIVNEGISKQVSIRVTDPTGNLDYIGETVVDDSGHFTLQYTSECYEYGYYTADVSCIGLSEPEKVIFEDAQAATPGFHNIFVTMESSNKLVVITGNIDSGNGKRVTVRVTDPEGNLDYLGETISGAEGSFEFSYISERLTQGTFYVELGGDGQDVPVLVNFNNIISIDDHCFIATAAYGSKFQPAVVILRQFRDHYLLTNTVGTTFVNFYYKNSPPIAAFIADSGLLKVMVRILLAPVIVLAYLAFHLDILVIMVTLILGIILCIRKLKVNLV